MAVNPKEYLEMFKDYLINKKPKRIKKGSTGMGSENFSERIKPLVSFETFEKPPGQYKELLRFSVVKREKIKKRYKKLNFLS